MQTTPHPTFPPQHQTQQPGIEAAMHPKPQYSNPRYKAAGKLYGRKALITGGEAVSPRYVLVYAKEGAESLFCT